MKTFGNIIVSGIVLVGLSGLVDGKTAKTLGSGSVTMVKPDPAKVGDTVNFVVSASSGSGQLMYSWDFGDGTAPTAYSVNSDTFHVYKFNRHFSVTVTQKDGTGGLATSTQLLTIYSPMPKSLPSNSSTIVLNPSNGLIYSVNADGNTVTVLDPGMAGKIPVKIAELQVGENPEALALGADDKIWVINRTSASISIIDCKSNTVTGTIALPYASQPYGIAASPVENCFYVTLQALGKLAKVDSRLRAVSGPLIEAGPQPRGIAISSDGKRILVTRFISPNSGGEIREINGTSLAITRTFVLPIDTKTADTELSSRGLPNYLVAIGISPDGSTAWVTHKKDNILRGLARDGLPMNDENLVRTAVSQINLKDNTIGNVIDINDRSMANAVAFSPLGDLTFVATLGSNTIEIFDALDPINALMATIPTELAPRGMVVTPDGDRIVVLNYLGRSLQVFDIAGVTHFTDNLHPLIAKIPAMAKEPLSPDVLRGKQIFYNADTRNMNEHGYVTCVVCHLDGGEDGRTWDFTDRGEGLRNTISLQGHGGLANGPLFWSANFDEIQDFEHEIRGAFSGRGFMSDAAFTQGTTNTHLGDPKAGKSIELDALAAYVTSLNVIPPSPYRNPDGSMTAEALAGKKLFESDTLGCTSCHTPDNFTDSYFPQAADIPKPETLDSNGYFQEDINKFISREGYILHNVGTIKSPQMEGRDGKILVGIDTPSLLGLWNTAPYFHDGSKATLADLLTVGNVKSEHVVTAKLSKTEIRQLEAYLMQLDGNPPDFQTGVKSIGNIKATPGVHWKLSGKNIEFHMSAKRLDSRDQRVLRLYTSSGKQIVRLTSVPGYPGEGFHWIWKNVTPYHGLFYPVVSE